MGVTQLSLLYILESCSHTATMMMMITLNFVCSLYSIVDVLLTKQFCIGFIDTEHEARLCPSSAAAAGRLTSRLTDNRQIQNNKRQSPAGMLCLLTNHCHRLINTAHLNGHSNKIEKNLFCYKQKSKHVMGTYVCELMSICVPSSCRALQ